MSFSPSRFLPIVGFLAADVIALGIGMGVPVFTILLGLPVGWLLPGVLRINSPFGANEMKALLRGAVVTSVFTFAMVAVIWLPMLRMLADPTADIANFGIPMVLYEPLPSFIGWIVLMVVISPALQALTTVFGSVLRCAFLPTAYGTIAGA